MGHCLGGEARDFPRDADQDRDATATERDHRAESSTVTLDERVKYEVGALFLERAIAKAHLEAAEKELAAVTAAHELTKAPPVPPAVEDDGA